MGSIARPVARRRSWPRCGLLALENWASRAACAPNRRPLDLEPKDWQPDEPGARVYRAREVCRGCVVRRQCGSHALRAREPSGIWGGLDAGQRGSERRR